MSRRRLILLLLTVAVGAGCAGGTDTLGLGGTTTTEPQAGRSFTARVVRIVDGDTIKIRRDGTRDTVRLIGIDTPESVKPGAPVECFAKEASRETTRLLDGERVKLVLDREPRDRYDRLLAYVYRERDGRAINEWLVRRGYAQTLRIAPNTRFAERFERAQERARAESRGLWARCS